MKWTKSQITEYAHEYLQGYNTVPIGVLDDAFFKSECRRLWGPEPTAAEKDAERKRQFRLLKRMEQALMPLYGPRGGLDKKYRELEWQYHMLKGELELSK